MEIQENDFKVLTRYIHQICGISLSNEKKYLVEQRLESIVKSSGCQNFTEFARLVSSFPDPQLRDQIIIAITTNETSFFRDGHPFDALRNKILPSLSTKIRERKNKPYTRKGAKVSIWSAGCSTGQEPYSISMVIHEFTQMNASDGCDPADFSILATDISPRVLGRAISGEYTEFEMSRGLHDIQKAVYFDKIDNNWSVKEFIRKIVEFRTVNLVEPFGYLGGFDVIFCRNILIYFDDQTKKKILDQFHYLLAEDGFLVLGATENMYNLSIAFESEYIGNTALYKKKPTSQN